MQQENKIVDEKKSEAGEYLGLVKDHEKVKENVEEEAETKRSEKTPGEANMMKN